MRILNEYIVLRESFIFSRELSVHLMQLGALIVVVCFLSSGKIPKDCVYLLNRYCSVSWFSCL